MIMVFQVRLFPINIARIFPNYNPSHGLHLKPKLYSRPAQKSPICGEFPLHKRVSPLSLFSPVVAQKFDQ